MTMPGPDPIAVRRAYDAAEAAGCPTNILAMLAGNQIAKVVKTMLDVNPLVRKGALRVELTEQQLNPLTTEDGLTFTFRWNRPTEEDLKAAASLGIGSDR